MIDPIAKMGSEKGVGVDIPFPIRIAPPHGDPIVSRFPDEKRNIDSDPFFAGLDPIRPAGRPRREPE